MQDHGRMDEGSKQAKKLWRDRVSEEVPWSGEDGVCQGMIVRCEVDDMEFIGHIANASEDLVVVIGMRGTGGQRPWARWMRLGMR